MFLLICHNTYFLHDVQALKFVPCVEIQRKVFFKKFTFIQYHSDLGEMKTVGLNPMVSVEMAPHMRGHDIDGCLV